MIALVLYEYCPTGCWVMAVIGKGGKFLRRYQCSQCGKKMIFEKYYTDW